MGLLSKIWKAVNPLRQIKKVLSWIMPQPDMPEAQPITVSKQGSDHAIPVVYGTRQVGAIIVHKYVTDAAGGAANEFLHLICVFCEGPVDAIEEIYFDGVSEFDPKWVKNGIKWHKITRVLGNDDQLAIVNTGIPNWNSAHRLRGLAYAHIRLQMDSDQSVWGGEPQIKARIRGRKIFDPRTGQTQYSENLPLQLLDYLTNTRYSKGFPQARIKSSSFIDAANWADGNITVETTVNGVSQTVTQKRITGNVAIDTGVSVFANVKTLLSGMRGMMPIGSGVVSLTTEREGAPLFYFGHNRSEKTNYAFITGPIRSRAGRKSERFNRVGVRFANKALNYESDEVFYPDATSALYAEWLAEDNGIVLEQSFEMVTITNKAEAYQMAEVIAKRSRNRMECSFAASPLAILVEPGDIVGITDDTRGWIEKPFRIEQIKIREDGDIDVEAIEHQNAIYPWSGVAYSERTEGTNLGDPTKISAPTGLVITPDLTLATGGRLQWSSTADAFIRRFKVKVLVGTDTLWTTETTAFSVDLPVLQPGTYTVTVNAVSTLGTLSPTASLSYSWSAPVTPTSLDVIAGNFEITVRPVLAGIGLGTEFEFALNDTNTVLGRGISMVFAGLTPNTQYAVFARAVNPLGNSDWLSAQVSTTAVADEIWDLIRDDVESNFQPVFDGLNQQLDDALALVDSSTKALNSKISIEQVERKKLDRQLFDAMAATVRLRAKLEGQSTTLHDAVFVVDPATGQIINRAYSYADQKFTEASFIIDGVAGNVTAAVSRITDTENRLTSAESSLALLPGEISLRATYTEVTEQIAGAIDAILPAYSFGFFNSLEGWSAVNGTMSAGISQASTTLGDFQNAALSFIGADNPVITINIQRTGGTGWAGDVIAVVNGVTRTFAGVIEPISAGGFIVRNLNLAGENTFAGTVTSLRFKLGLTTADTFIIKSITIGKPSASYEQIAGLSAQVSTVGQDLNALRGTLTNYVTTAWYNSNALKLSDVNTQISSFDTTYSISATLQQLSAADTIAKANAAKQWVDGANATISDAVSAFLALPGGVNQTLGEFSGQFTAVSDQISALDGSITQQAVSFSKLKLTGKNLEKAAFYAELERLKMRDNLLEAGSSAAIANRDVQALALDKEALAQEVFELKASTATSVGQLNASIAQTAQAVTDETSARAAAISSLSTDLSSNFQAQSDLIQNVKSTADGAAEALAGLRTAVAGSNSQSQAELILSSTVSKAGAAHARAFLGTSSTDNEGKKKVTGIVVDGENSGLEFSADVLILTDSDGGKRLYWDAASGTFVFKGKLVLTDGTPINQVSDIRGQDGAPGTQGPQGPQGTAGLNGSNGSAGAGFYTVVLRDGIFPTNAQANTDFAAAIGRSPVNGDVLTYRNASGTVSSAKQFNGTLWGAPTALIAGSLIATGSISGDKFMAGTSITAPIINGGTIQMVGTDYMEIKSATPFGPHGLIEWYGPKIAGVNFNTATQEVIPSGLLKGNAKIFKSASGAAYFGGSISAGTLRNAQTSTALSQTASIETGQYSSNGGIITIKNSISISIFQTSNTSFTPASVTATLRLFTQSGQSWVEVSSQVVTGRYVQSNEGGEYIQSWDLDGSFTHTDMQQVASNRNYKLTVTHNLPVWAGGQVSQKLSIISEE